MLYCSSECGSISIMQLRTIYCNTHVYTFHVCLCLLALTFVSNSTYLLKLEVQRYDSKQRDALHGLNTCMLSIPIFTLRTSTFSVLLNVILSKYLNLIDSNCDVDESCPWFFYRDCPCHRPWMYYHIYVILGRRNLFEMSAVCSRSVGKPARHLVMQLQIFLCL